MKHSILFRTALWGLSAGIHLAASLVFLALPGTRDISESDRFIEEMPPMHIMMTVEGSQYETKQLDTEDCNATEPVPEIEGENDKNENKPEPEPELQTECQGTALSTVLKPADYSENSPPPYPRLARRLGYEGRVILCVQIDCSGKCISAVIAASSGYPILDRAALNAVTEWEFDPALRNGIPVTSSMTIPIRFSLN